MRRKFIFYLRDYNRGIVITDDSELTEDKIKKMISTSMTSAKVESFETGNDILMVRPSDIVAVQVVSDSFDKRSGKNKKEIKEETIDIADIEEDLDLGGEESEDTEPEIIEEEQSIVVEEIDVDITNEGKPKSDKPHETPIPEDILKEAKDIDYGVKEV